MSVRAYRHRILCHLSDGTSHSATVSARIILENGIRCDYQELRTDAQVENSIIGKELILENPPRRARVVRIDFLPWTLAN